MSKKTALLPMLFGVGMSIAISASASYAASFQEVSSLPTTLQEGPPLPDPASPGRSSEAAQVPPARSDAGVGFQTDIEFETRALRVQRQSAAHRADSDSTIVSPPTPGLPTLDGFIASVKSASAEIITGVYVPGVLALRVVAQPANRPTYVSPEFGVATLYCGLGPCGSIGLLAHNYLSGMLFFLLAPKQAVVIIRGDGSAVFYRVSSIRRFQALRPLDPYSTFVDLNNGATLSSSELFQQIYGAGNQVVFQTCMANEGLPSWGRLFVIADPA